MIFPKHRQVQHTRLKLFYNLHRLWKKNHNSLVLHNLAPAYLSSHFLVHSPELPMSYALTIRTILQFLKFTPFSCTSLSCTNLSAGKILLYCKFCQTPDFFWCLNIPTICGHPGQVTRCTGVIRQVPTTSSPLALPMIFKHTNEISSCHCLVYSTLISSKGTCPWLPICLVGPTPLALLCYGPLRDMPCLLLLRPVNVINPLISSASPGVTSMVLLECSLKTPQGGLTLPFTMYCIGQKACSGFS